MHQPSKIPTEMWQVFRQIDKIKDKITNNSAGNITAESQGTVVSCNKYSDYVHKNLIILCIIHKIVIE